MNLDPALQTFIAESRELLERMEEALLRLETDLGDADLIDEIFRAAHTIKGSAGIFGFDVIVEFTHHVETLLDEMRAASIEVTPVRVALLLECGDHIKEIIEPVMAAEELDAQMQARAAALLDRVKSEMTERTSAAAPVPSPVDEGEHTAVPLYFGEPVATTECWHLSLRFGEDVLRNGMDPLSFLRYLGRIAEIVQIHTVVDAIPDAEEMDPESCYLGFEITLRSDAAKAELEAVFDFVRDDCRLQIIPPRSRLSEYIQLIAELPEDTLRLGEMLVKSGALTQAELESGLNRQAAEDAEAIPVPAQGEHQRPLGEILVEQGAVPNTVVKAALERQTQVREQKTKDTKLVRVDADKLDQLITLVGELVTAGAGTRLLVESVGNMELQESVALLSRLIEDIRDEALGLRMVQIGPMFQRFQRVVRDVSKQLDKDIRLVIEGGDTELDKTMVEKISDPLMHLVRNSLDHGIGTPEYRLARGKPAQGTLTLRARHDAGSVVIEVADDGEGLNRQRILAKAVERGLVAENTQLSDREIDGLIFQPGFSTADQVSNISGRGVGMDVVRRNIESLRGSIDVISRPADGEMAAGDGTTMRIRLPLTLAIIDGFLIGIERARYVVPVELVAECLELPPDSRDAVLARGYLDLRGEVLPILSLRKLFGATGTSRPRRENVVVVRFGDHKAGIVVDELLGDHQTVIKPMGKLFDGLKGVIGSTILGGGEIALILDVPGLVQLARAQQHAAIAEVDRGNRLRHPVNA